MKGERKAVDSAVRRVGDVIGGNRETAQARLASPAGKVKLESLKTFVAASQPPGPGLERRNFAATIIRTYLHGVAHFSLYYRRPPDQLGPEDIRKYQAMLFTKLRFSPNTVILRLAALRFFYIHVLKRN